MLIGSKWVVLISLFSMAGIASCMVPVASHLYVRDLQTCTAVSACSGFFLEQHQLFIKEPSYLYHDFLNVFVFVHLDDRKPQADLI